MSTKTEPRVWDGRHILLTWARAVGPEPRQHGVRDYFDEMMEAGEKLGWTFTSVATVDEERDKNENPAIEKAAGELKALIEQLERSHFELRLNSDVGRAWQIRDVAEELEALGESLYAIEAEDEDDMEEAA